MRASLAFAGGLAITAAILAPALYPVATYRLWCAIVHGGAVPSTEGLLVTLGAPPPGTVGPGAGPWVALEIRNVGRAPTSLRVPERFGDELAFTVTGPSGPVAATQRRDTLASWLHTTVLGPGERVAFVCDLSRWVAFPAPGIYAVRATHHHLVAGLRKAAVSVSNSFEILVQ